MGIINLTPDSFYAPSCKPSVSEALAQASAMVQAGADILDIGACSTRPGSESAGEEQEMERLAAPLDAIRKAFPHTLVSVDTFRASVAKECLRRWDVDIINDVSGGTDPEMLKVVARHGAGYILMHMRGTPADMQTKCNYKDVVAEVIEELAFRVDAARRAGVCNLIVDPGFGFAKDTMQNFALLRNLNKFEVLGCPVLVGMSRKKMVREAGECELSDSLTSTIALNAVALTNGASIIRVHDVREGVQTAKTIGRLWKA